MALQDASAQRFDSCAGWLYKAFTAFLEWVIR